MSVQLYLVTASVSELDEFVAAVVYAGSPDEAVWFVDEQCHSHLPEDNPAGAWMPVNPDAEVTVTLVPRQRGPVLGHSNGG